MRIIISGLLTTVLVLFLTGCNQHSAPSISDESHTKMNTHSDTLVLRLNNGERWVVNDEMKPFVEQAELMLEEFLASKSDDYTTLAVKLDELNMGLIQSCTMTGESHEELHIWLAPHMEMTLALGKAASAEDANVMVNKLKGSFETYHRHFQ